MGENRTGIAVPPDRQTGRPQTEAATDVAAAYDAHGADLYRVALGRLGDPVNAQDAVQETFLRAWRGLDTFDHTVAGFREWLFGILRHVVVDEFRRARVRPWQRAYELDADRDGVSPDRRTFEGRLVDAWTVEEALTRISPEHREVIVAVHLQSRPQQEVADELQIPVGTVRSRVHLGLRALRRVLESMEKPR